MALRAPDVRVVAITTVAGNVPVAQSTRNALYTVELCGANVPVHAGADEPLVRTHQSATWFHGKEANPRIVMVTLGPLTNVARALVKKPGIAAKVGRCVIMGGAPCCEGNVTPAAEYNIWVDPEAARIVMNSGMPIELVGWHLSRGDAVVREDDIARILPLNTPTAKFAIECNSLARQAYKVQTGEDGISLPDPIAMAIALDPTIGTEWSEHYVDVETQSELTRGMTVVDRLNVASDARNQVVWAPVLEKKCKARVYWTMDNHRWKESLLNALH